MTLFVLNQLQLEKQKGGNAELGVRNTQQDYICHLKDIEYV